MDQLPTLEGMLSFSKEKDMWELNGKWAMGKVNDTAAGFHFTNKNNCGAADSPDGK